MRISASTNINYVKKSLAGYLLGFISTHNDEPRSESWKEIKKRHGFKRPQRHDSLLRQ
jgi:hypothetical protein